MSLFHILIVVGVICAVSAKQLSDDEKKMVKGQLKKCQEKVGATDEQIDNLLDGKDTNSDIAKCLAACALEQYTIIDRQSDDTCQINPDSVESVARMKFQDESKIATIKKAAENCKSSVKAAECCAYTAELIKCLKDEAEKNNMKLDE